MKFKKRPEVVVDVFIPSSRFAEFYTWYKKDFDFYPLWIVPYMISKMYPWVDPKYASQIKDDLFIDCAVYGKINNKPNIDYSELLEKKMNIDSTEGSSYIEHSRLRDYYEQSQGSKE